MRYNKISILGCGWLGFPLAKTLLSHFHKVTVKGSTTTAAKLDLFEKAKVEGYLFSLDPNFNGVSAHPFFDTDCLIIAIPPRISQKGPDNYSRQILEMMELPGFSNLKNVILISSTSVYRELNRMVVEDDVMQPEQSASPSIVEVENLLQSLRPAKTVTILRMGGLMGFDRIPGKYVSGQKNLPTGSIPVNYIHQTDAIGVIIKILENGLVNETFNVVAPLHPTRRAVYESSCSSFSWECPTFENPVDPIDFKVVSGEKLLEFYPYRFKFPDPLGFYYAI